MGGKSAVATPDGRIRKNDRRNQIKSRRAKISKNIREAEIVRTCREKDRGGRL